MEKFKSQKMLETYIARSSASSSVNADNTISNNSIVVIAFFIGHDRDVMNHLQGGADAWSRVGGLAPSNNRHHFSGWAFMSLGWETAGLDVVIELNWFRQFNQSNIIGKSAVIPVFMGESIEGGDFNTVWLTASTHIVGTSHNVKVQGILKRRGLFANHISWRRVKLRAYLLPQCLC